MPNYTRAQGQLQVLKLQDFTLGVIGNSIVPTFNPLNMLASLVSTRVPSSQLSCSVSTYGVMGLPNGGLLLGPSTAQTITVPVTPPTGVTNIAVTGVINNGTFGAFGNSNVIFSGINATPVQVDICYFGWNGAISNPTDLSFFTNQVLSGGYIGGAGVGHTFPFDTIVDITVSGSTQPTEAICCTNGFGVSNTMDHEYFPIQGGGSAGKFDTGRKGFIIPANGRVWLIEQGSNLSYYDTISFTDPALGTANNVTMGSQFTRVTYDNPSTFGAWGVLASGQQLLIKSLNEGAVIISGDIFNPSVTVANAVQGTNGMIEQAAVCPLGLIYFSQNNGVYAWSGGSFATNLSQNIPSSLFLCPWTSTLALGTNSPHNPSLQPQTGINAYYYYNCLFFTGGLFMDLRTNAWWRLPPYFSSSDSTPYIPLFYLPTQNGQISSPNAVFDFQTFWIGRPGTATQLTKLDYAFDMGNGTGGGMIPPAGFYHSYFESNPLIIANNDIVEVQQIDIVIQGKGNLTVTCFGIGGAVISPRTVAVNSAGFTRISLTTSFETDVLILGIGYTQTGNSVTPMISEIDISYRPILPVPKS